MFRMGDFYEMFFDDAVEVGPVLDIVVTTRDRNVEDPVPMAGVPWHAVGSYLRTLVERGYKVAICEQLESPEEAKRRRGPDKIVRRDVVQVVSPGALLDEEHLQASEPNYMVALVESTREGGAWAVAALDISQGEIVVTMAPHADALRGEIARLAAREILVLPNAAATVDELLGPDHARVSPLAVDESVLASLSSAATTRSGKARSQVATPRGAKPGTDGAGDNAMHVALARVDAMLKDTGLQDIGGAERLAAAMVVCYASATQPGKTLLLSRVRVHDRRSHLVLDDISLRNLEVFRTLRDQQRKGSVLWSIDETVTAIGARTLREWVSAPLLSIPAIVQRQQAIEALVADGVTRAQIQSCLKGVRDMVRLAARARLETITPRELAALRESLRALPALQSQLTRLLGLSTSDLRLLDLGADLQQTLLAELDRVLADVPALHLREGGVIRDGADPRLDVQRDLAAGGREQLAQIEVQEREQSGIDRVRVQHNRVFGYFIEIARSQASKAPAHWVRKQTTATTERYITEQLAELESKVLAAQGEAMTLEQELFAQLRTMVSRAAEALSILGERCGVIDSLCGLAQVASARNWVAPRVVEEPVLEIEEGRHPVLERLMERGHFVPNTLVLAAPGQEPARSVVESIPGADPQQPLIAGLASGPASQAKSERAASLDAAGRGEGGGLSRMTATTTLSTAPRLLLITGPNMGGKSTVMRQAALIVLLAQMGSFVPASSARIGLCDRVFTRVGAADDLGRGESTFMVEMRETAQILTHATPRSLVLFDEVGRGTSTYDGLALAWAITEFLHDQVRCRSLFATHYHELCILENRLAGLANAHVTVHESRGTMTFLHRLEPGYAGRSYGIAVGRLAALPARVLRRAQRLLERLEARDQQRAGAQLDLFAATQAARSDEEDGLDGGVFGLPGLHDGVSNVAGRSREGNTADGSDRTQDPRGRISAWPDSAGEALSLLEDLAVIDPDDLSPRDAHQLLRELTSRALIARRSLS